MSTWNHTMCEKDWFETRADVKEQPDGILELRMPNQRKPGNLAQCCFCGALTVAGILVREDPSKLMCQGKHPGDEDDD